MTSAILQIAKARQEIKNHRFEAAMSILSEIKGSHLAVQDTDFFRAQCFVSKGQPWSAIAALREELRLYPDNEGAATLLAQLTSQYSDAVNSALGDAEFQRISRSIREYTMLTEARLWSLFGLAKEVCVQGLPGQFVECGVAAGGSSALLAAVIAQYSTQARRLYAFDSFEGMPAPSHQDQHHGQLADDSGWGTGTCAAPQSSLVAVCRSLGVEHLVEPVKGWFEETLPKHSTRIGPIAILHMDGDWYDSTRTILRYLYDQVVSGGRIQIDDYGYWEGCRKAVIEFENSRSLKFHLHTIDDTGVWFEKP